MTPSRKLFCIKHVETDTWCVSSRGTFSANLDEAAIFHNEDNANKAKRELNRRHETYGTTIYDQPKYESTFVATFVVVPFIMTPAT